LGEFTLVEGPTGVNKSGFLVNVVARLTESNRSKKWSRPVQHEPTKGGTTSMFPENVDLEAHLRRITEVVLHHRMT
jgi:hypothetical protein